MAADFSISFAITDASEAPFDWCVQPAALPPFSDVVHLWRVQLQCESKDELQLLAGTLSDDERARADRFQFAPHRDRYIVGRALLRGILGRYLTTDPDEIRFEYGRWGKPRLVGQTGLHFNVSHAEDLGLIAVRGVGPVGIDVERVDPSFDFRAIMADHFSPEEACGVANAPSAVQTETFFGVWTRREALLKAIGVGLSGLTPISGAALLPGTHAIREFVPAPGMVAAIATLADPGEP